MIANTITSAESPEINNAIPNFAAVEGSLFRLRR